MCILASLLPAALSGQPCNPFTSCDPGSGGGGGGPGTVTSVDLAVPAEWTVSGNPITTSGTITIAEATQTANTCYAGPSSGGAAAPGFRALVAADIPASLTGSNAATATAFAANGANCSAGSYPLGVDASGAVEGCTVAATGDITSVGDVASGAAFDGTQGTALTFNDADGDQTITYDTTNNRFAVSDEWIVPAGTALLPSLAFASATTSGFYMTEAGTIRVSIGAVEKFRFDSTSNRFYHATGWGGITGNNGQASATNVTLCPDCVDDLDTGLGWAADGSATLVSNATEAMRTRTGGWVRRANGDSYLAADQTNATDTLASTTISTSVVTGRKYTFKAIFYLADSVAAEGAKLDFDGGTATATSFRVHCTGFDSALVLSSQSSALATDFTIATLTGDGVVECHGSLETSSTGTFLPRFAQNTHATGTLTLYRGSHVSTVEAP